MFINTESEILLMVRHIVNFFCKLEIGRYINNLAFEKIIAIGTVYRVYICPRGNISYIINNTISTLNNSKSTHHKSTLNPDLPYNQLP